MHPCHSSASVVVARLVLSRSGPIDPVFFRSPLTIGRCALAEINPGANIIDYPAMSVDSTSALKRQGNNEASVQGDQIYYPEACQAYTLARLTAIWQICLAVSRLLLITWTSSRCEVLNSCIQNATNGVPRSHEASQKKVSFICCRQLYRSSGDTSYTTRCNSGPQPSVLHHRKRRKV